MGKKCKIKDVKDPLVISKAQELFETEEIEFISFECNEDDEEE